MVHRVVPMSRLLATALALARTLTGLDPALVQAIRRTVRAAFDVPLDSGIELERRLGLGLQARRS
jgi:enoyl-CoA hydratase/carnithine racemase